MNHNNQNPQSSYGHHERHRPRHHTTQSNNTQWSYSQNFPPNLNAPCNPSNETQRAVYPRNFGQRPMPKLKYHGKRFNFDQSRETENQRGWGKRSHEQTSLNNSATSSSSEPQTPNSETSPSPKSRIVQSPNSIDKPTIKPMPKKKIPVVSPATKIQAQKDEKWAILIAQALRHLEICTPGEEVNTLLFYLQPPRSECMVLKETIRSDLLNLLQPLGVKDLMVFGSTLTGLDFKGSDLDFHVQLIKKPSSDDEVRQLIQMSAKLTRRNLDFRMIYWILHARVPLIRLAHNKTTTTCDINFTSRFGFYNSCFIGQILSYDKRIKDLAVIIKLWSKSYKVAERTVMSNYCIVMLMIFYLQNLEHPMLKTIKENQQEREPMVLDWKYKWNFFFNNSINKSSENNQTVRELLVGFFEFYQKLNFANYIVSLYSGELVKRKDFDTHPDFDDYRRIIAESELPPLKFDNPQMFIVQDGFEQNLNIGIKCKKHHDYFIALLKASYELCQELKNEPLSTLMTKLFTCVKIPEPEIEKRLMTRAKKKFQMKIHAIADDLRVRNLSKFRSEFTNYCFADLPGNSKSRKPEHGRLR